MNDFAPACPLPLAEYPHVLLAHGGGGKLMHQLIERLLLPAFRNTMLEARHDGAVFSAGSARLAMTTDSYVVRPLFFPGGDIGQLAIYGTVNDLAMCGARPLFVSIGLILEEGLPMETLCRVVDSIQRASEQTRVQIITGDTKVVDRGSGDGIFINATGIGWVEPERSISPCHVRPGDLVLLNGDVGRHGMAIMSTREGLMFESAIESDAAPLTDLVLALLDAGIDVHCLRDLTRGGLASALVEIAQTAQVRVDLDETAIPVRQEVRAACEILGLDPLYVANEGRFVAFVPEADTERALAVMRADPLGDQAAVIGRVNRDDPGLVTLKTWLGTSRVVDLISGEQLPRIC